MLMYTLLIHTHPANTHTNILEVGMQPEVPAQSSSGNRDYRSCWGRQIPSSNRVKMQVSWAEPRTEPYPTQASGRRSQARMLATALGDRRQYKDSKWVAGFQDVCAAVWSPKIVNSPWEGRQKSQMSGRPLQREHSTLGTTST